MTPDIKHAGHDLVQKPLWRGVDQTDPKFFKDDFEETFLPSTIGSFIQYSETSTSKLRCQEKLLEERRKDRERKDNNDEYLFKIFLTSRN